jgi:hypothetical protein
MAQGKKRATEFLAASTRQIGESPLLEISRYSGSKEGQMLSAFNLRFCLPEHPATTVECAFQGSKVFENGGPFTDLLSGTSIEAKRDSRLTTSGNLTGFCLGEREWPLTPQTAFYDWLYLNAVHADSTLGDVLMKHVGFSDVAFNPKKSINCQARAAAFYCVLRELNLLSVVLGDQEEFIQIHRELLGDHSGLELWQ